MRRGVVWGVIGLLFSLFLAASLAFREACRTAERMDVRCTTIDNARIAISALSERIRAAFDD